MKHCIYCGLELSDGVTVCNGCKQIVGSSQGSQDQNPSVAFDSSSELAVGQQKAAQAAAASAPAEKSEGILAKVLKFIGF